MNPERTEKKGKGFDLAATQYSLIKDYIPNNDDNLQRLILSVVDDGAFVANVAIFLKPEVALEH